jgi:RND family efflux transporter MFP subunit
MNPDGLPKRLPIVLGLLVGAFLIAVFVIYQKFPERTEAAGGPAVAVTVIDARNSPFRFEARGHGIARPSETWRAIANVAGRVVTRHPNLESGTMLPKGTLLLALDPSRYQLAIADAKSSAEGLSIEQVKLATEEANTQRLLKLEQERLALSERDYARIEKLFRSGTLAQAQLDDQLRATLAQRQAVATLKNTLALIPARRNILKAQQESAGVRLAQAQRDLADTRFVAPYDLRLSKVDAELHQFVGAGQVLFQADNIAAAEVEARIPFSMMSRLLGNMAFSPDKTKSIEGRVALSALRADLTLVGAGQVFWQGRVVRIASGLDPSTRTVRVIIQVDRPYDNVRPPDRPPLQQGMYTRVRLSAMSTEPMMVVPASAVHQGELWLADNNNQLVRRPVKIAFEQHDLAVVAEGLAPGERVIIDDLATAIQGMALAPTLSKSVQDALASRAAGEEP